MSSADSVRRPGVADLQRRVQEWCDTEWGGEYWPPLGNLARLIEEVGEVARVVNDRYGYKPKKADEPPQELALELGDVLFTLVALANATGVDLNAAFDAVLEKYRRRDTGRYQAGQQVQEADDERGKRSTMSGQAHFN